jgi:hypothetical protein
VILWCKFFGLRKFKLWLPLVLLMTGCATFESPVNAEREGGDKSHMQQEESNPLAVSQEPEVQSAESLTKIGKSLKAENNSNKSRNGEENAEMGLAAQEEAKTFLTQQEAELTARLKSAYEAQLNLKEQLITDLERQLGVMTSEVNEKMESVEELVALLNVTNDLLVELEKEVKKYAQLDDRGDLVNPLAKARLLELEHKVRILRPSISGC